eukprot:TRINITY_DN1712_c0_g1_i1.p1 TRINITY_DN1712_c0_g1~~TRINITY_DN1712_c0_g1_i1.p1  ORF type:complete len:648 (-),score=83.78 TRINITY_DN1712_c0_g1_i1:609-2381(-)
MSHIPNEHEVMSPVDAEVGRGPRVALLHPDTSQLVTEHQPAFRSYPSYPIKQVEHAPACRGTALFKAAVGIACLVAVVVVGTFVIHSGAYCGVPHLAAANTSRHGAESAMGGARWWNWGASKSTSKSTESEKESIWDKWYSWERKRKDRSESDDVSSDGSDSSDESDESDDGSAEQESGLEERFVEFVCAALRPRVCVLKDASANAADDATGAGHEARLLGTGSVHVHWAERACHAAGGDTDGWLRVQLDASADGQSVNVTANGVVLLQLATDDCHAEWTLLPDEATAGARHRFEVLATVPAETAVGGTSGGSTRRAGGRALAGARRSARQWDGEFDGTNPNSGNGGWGDGFEGASPMHLPAQCAGAPPDLPDLVQEVPLGGSPLPSGPAVERARLFHSLWRRLWTRRAYMALTEISAALAHRGLDGATRPDLRAVHLLAAAAARAAGTSSAEVLERSTAPLWECPATVEPTASQVEVPPTTTADARTAVTAATAHRRAGVGSLVVPCPSPESCCAQSHDCYGQCGGQCRCWKGVCGHCEWAAGCHDQESWCRRCDAGDVRMCAACFAPPAAWAPPCDPFGSEAGTCPAP